MSGTEGFMGARVADVLGIVGGVVFVLLLQTFLARSPAAKSLRKPSEVIAFYANLVGVLFTVALAFIMVAAWEHFDQTQQLVETECSQLESIAFLARGLPVSSGGPIVHETRNYAKLILEDEWPSLAHGKPSNKVNDSSDRIGMALLQFKPGNLRDQSLLQLALERFTLLRNMRHDRRLASEYRIPTPLWLVMWFGAVATIGLCLLFGVEHRKLHMGSIAVLTAFILTFMVVIGDLQNPFSGLSTINPHAFEKFLKNDHYADDATWTKISGMTVASPEVAEAARPGQQER